MRSTLAVFAVIFGMGTAAQADTMLTAPAYGGPAQKVAVCYYSFYAPTTISNSYILVEPGNAVAETSELCGGQEISGRRCRTVANIANNLAHWCLVVMNNKTAVRGRLEIRDASGNVLTSETAY